MNDKNKEMKLLLYHTEENDISVNAVIQNDTLWITQKAMADVFGVERSVITKHLSNIYADQELLKDSTCAKFALVRDEGNRKVKRKVEFYNLDAIISVGYRVNSKRELHLNKTVNNILRKLRAGF